MFPDSSTWMLLGNKFTTAAAKLSPISVRFTVGYSI